MAFDFRLVVSGLCSFVPVAGQPPSMQVVLVNARDYDHEGDVLTGKTSNADIHIPFLVVPATFRTSGRKPTFPFVNDLLIPNVKLLAYVLDQDDLDITPVTPASVGLPGTVGACPQDQLEVTAFGWIARMKDIGAGTIKRDIDPTANDLLLARVSFAQGECFTSAFVPDPKQGNKGAKFTYSDDHGTEVGGNYTPRVLAEDVTVRIRIEHTSMVTLAPRNGREPIIIDNGGNALRAFLLNVPLPDLLNDKPRTAAPSRNEHFMHFGRLAATSGVTFAPKPKGGVCPDLGGSLGGPKCPSSFFEG